MRTIQILPLLLCGFCLTSSAQTFEYFCVAKHGATVIIKRGENGPDFESDAGTADIQWIIAKDKVRSLDVFGEIPCKKFEKSIHCKYENSTQPYFTLFLEDNSFIFQTVLGTPDSDLYWSTYAGTCTSVDVDE